MVELKAFDTDDPDINFRLKLYQILLGYTLFSINKTLTSQTLTLKTFVTS